MKRKFAESTYNFKEKCNELRNAAEELSGQYEKELQRCREFQAELVRDQAAWQEEKKRMAHIQKFKPHIQLDVGGYCFRTSLTTLRRFPDTMIGVMFSGRHALPLDEEGYFFIDRDGVHFRHILNFLRQPEGFKVDLPEGQLEELKRECEYYGLLEVMFPPCQPHTMIVRTDSGQICTITRDADGVWRADNIPLEVCRECGSAEVLSWHPRFHGYVSKGILPNFTSGSLSCKVYDSQPQPEDCAFCGYQGARW
jgi:hypothetical protein